MYNRFDKGASNIETMSEEIHCSPPRNISWRDKIGLTRNYWQPIITSFHYLLQIMTLQTRTTFSPANHRASYVIIASDAIQPRQ